MDEHFIDVDILDPQSIDQARRALREFRSVYIMQRMHELTRALGNIAVQAAQGAYGGHSIIVTSSWVDERTIEIRADGDGIVFLEFGAGDTVNSGNRYAPAMPFEVSSGSWSREHARQYEDYRRWEFPPGSGNWMTAVEPRNGMERAYEAIMTNVYTEARRIFG